jgi:hypothetical protein
VCVCVVRYRSVSATADRSSGGVLPSEGSLAECDLEALIMKRLRPTWLSSHEGERGGDTLHIPYIT